MSSIVSAPKGCFHSTEHVVFLQSLFIFARWLIPKFFSTLSYIDILCVAENFLLDINKRENPPEATSSLSSMLDVSPGEHGA